jgi:TM2 domain-containing membrane protein YozV
MQTLATRFKSKTTTALLALLIGSFGAHRFYLYGNRDKAGWAHLAGLAMALTGVSLLLASHRASLLGWALAIPGVISPLAALLAAIVYGLRPDEKWDAQFNPGLERRSHSGWSVVLLVIAALFIGACSLMGGLAIGFQTYFESQGGAGTP